MRSRLGNIAVVCVSILAALAACESGLRITDSYRPPDDPIQTRRPDLYLADPNVGYTLWPSKMTTDRHPEQSQVQWVYQTRWQRERNRYDLNEALLDRYLRTAGTIGFRPVVVFFPWSGDNDEDRERRAFLATWAAARGVPFADLTTAIHGAGVDKVYIQDNPHWNPLGHRIAAVELHNLLRRQLDEATPPS